MVLRPNPHWFCCKQPNFSRNQNQNDHFCRLRQSYLILIRYETAVHGGAGIVADYFTLSVDYDLNEEERYKDFKDNTQMIRVGGEIDIMRQLKLRAGYNKTSRTIILKERLRLVLACRH